VKRAAVCNSHAYHADEQAHECSVVCSVRLQLGGERQLRAVVALTDEALVKADVGDRDGKPGDEPGDRGHVGEPAEDLARARADTHEGELVAFQ
jgi:hypothetical protein